MKTTELFEVEQTGRTLLVSPLGDLKEFTSDELLQGDPAGLMELLDSGEVQNVVVDCRRVCVFCSAGFAYLIRLWKKASLQGGHMALCNASAHLLEAVDVLRLRKLWTVADSVEEALALIEQWPRTSAARDPHPSPVPGEEP